MQLPLSSTQQLAMRRNIEKLIVEAEGHAGARALLAGRAVDAVELPTNAPEVRAWSASVRGACASVECIAAREGCGGPC